MSRALMRRWLPDPQKLRASRSLRWLGPLLDRPWLWKADRRGIALGLALGTFFGLLVPFAQVVFAGAAAAWLRANLAAAVLATFVSNPFTTPFILVGAYHVGTSTLGDEASAPPPAEDMPWIDRLAAMGEPLLVGLLLVAVAGAGLAYASVQLAWRAASWSRLRRRRARQRA